MAEQLEEPMARILEAQRDNIARIETDLVIPGTTGRGEQIKLWGPCPNLIRLYDTPTRIVQAMALDNWERIITLAPLEDSGTERVIQRNDRAFRYSVQFLVRLTQSEQVADREQMVARGVKPENPLMVKAHRLVYDWHHIFSDDLLLETDGCPQGLVDHQEYRLLWDPGVEYPMTLFVAEVTGTRSAW